MLPNPLFTLRSFSEPPIVTSTRRTAVRPWAGDNLVTGSGIHGPNIQQVDRAIETMPAMLFGSPEAQ